MKYLAITLMPVCLMCNLAWSQTRVDPLKVTVTQVEGSDFTIKVLLKNISDSTIVMTGDLHHGADFPLFNTKFYLQSGQAFIPADQMYMNNLTTSKGSLILGKGDSISYKLNLNTFYQLNWFENMHNGFILQLENKFFLEYAGNVERILIISNPIMMKPPQ